MKSENKNKIGTSRFANFERIDRVPPLKMILYCSMGGIALLFFILAYLFLVNLAAVPSHEVLTTPKFFSVSMVLVLLSAFFIQQVPALYQQDELPGMKKNLLWALVLGAGFTIAQIIAWQEILNIKFSFNEYSAGTLLFLLSALHLLHFAGGIAFASYLFLKTSKAAADPVRTLIYIRDPFRNLQVEMLRTYWHFLGALWLVVYFIFLFAL